ncbi:hypothetical protein BDK51DRAFT_43192, partial [Blyttiomyces helicus]
KGEEPAAKKPRRQKRPKEKIEAEKKEKEEWRLAKEREKEAAEAEKKKKKEEREKKAEAKEKAPRWSCSDDAKLELFAMVRFLKDEHSEILKNQPGFIAWSTYFKDNIETKEGYPELKDLWLDTIKRRLKAKVHDICDATGGGGLEVMLEKHKMSKIVYKTYGELMHDNTGIHAVGRNEGPGRRNTLDDDTEDSGAPNEDNPFLNDHSDYSDGNSSSDGSGSDDSGLASDLENVNPVTTTPALRPKPSAKARGRSGTKTPGARSSTPAAPSSLRPKPPGALRVKKEPLDQRIQNEVAKTVEGVQQGMNAFMLLQLQQRWEETEARWEQEEREQEERREMQEREREEKEKRCREREERREEQRASQANVFQMGMMMMMSKMCSQSFDMGAFGALQSSGQDTE